MKKLVGLLAGVAIIAGTLAMSMPVASATEPGFDCPPPWFPINTIIGSRHNDVLNGTFCDDRILGLAGTDVLRGKAGEDRLRGGQDNDRLVTTETFGFPQADVANGGPGFDTCLGDTLDTFLNCEVVIEVDPF